MLRASSLERGRLVDAVGTEGADRLQYGQSAVWRPGTGQPPSLSQPQGGTRAIQQEAPDGDTVIRAKLKNCIYLVNSDITLVMKLSGGNCGLSDPKK